MAKRESVLIIEDDEGILNLYEEMLGRVYNVTPVFYGEMEIPTKRYNKAILDGLNGKWKNVGEQINVDKKILVSGDCDYIREASELGWLALGKPFKISKLLRILE